MLARPNDEERKRIAASKDAKKKLRDEAENRERQIHERVQKICAEAVQRSRGVDGVKWLSGASLHHLTVLLPRARRERARPAA